MTLKELSVCGFYPHGEVVWEALASQIPCFSPVCES